MLPVECRRGFSVNLSGLLQVVIRLLLALVALFIFYKFLNALQLFIPRRLDSVQTLLRLVLLQVHLEHANLRLGPLALLRGHAEGVVSVVFVGVRGFLRGQICHILLHRWLLAQRLADFGVASYDQWSTLDVTFDVDGRYNLAHEKFLALTVRPLFHGGAFVQAVLDDPLLHL